jgi:hypothetical protein
MKSEDTHIEQNLIHTSLTQQINGSFSEKMEDFTPELFYEEGILPPPTFTHLITSSTFSYSHTSSTLHFTVRQLFQNEIYLLQKDFYNEIVSVRLATQLIPPTSKIISRLQSKDNSPSPLKILIE